MPAWILFELVVTKLPHYVLPLYPAIAILTARVLASDQLSQNRFLRIGPLNWMIMAIVIPLVGIIAIAVLRRQIGLLAWPFAAGAMILGFIAWRLFPTDGAERSLLRATAAAVLAAVAVLGVIVPSLRPLFPSATVAAVLRDPGCADPKLAAAGYHEPSLVFLAGTATRLTDGAGAAEFLRQGPCRFALIEGRHERAFAQRAETIGLRYAPGPRIEGVNISGGRVISLALYRSEPAP